MSDSDGEVDCRKAHLCVVTRTHQGYGFNIRGQVAAGGVLRPINGELYMPMQYVSALVDDGPGVAAGLKLGDRVLAVNEQAVEGLSHSDVVELIRNSGGTLSMNVLSVTEVEAKHLEMDCRQPATQTPDVFERASIPVTIPSFSEETSSTGEPYVHYSIHLNGKHLCHKRYSEFDALAKVLKKKYSEISFPKLPPKWPFKLSPQKLEQRRRLLEEWLDTICSVKFLSESGEILDFIGVPEEC